MLYITFEFYIVYFKFNIFVILSLLPLLVLSYLRTFQGKKFGRGERCILSKLLCGG